MIKRIIVGTAKISEVQQRIQQQIASNSSHYNSEGRIVGESSVVEEEHAVSTNIEDYAQVILDMHDCKIEVFYAQGRKRDFGSDFAYFNVGTNKEPRRIVMKWYHDHERGRVVECQFIDWADESIEHIWKHLERRAFNVSKEIERVRKGKKTDPPDRRSQQAGASEQQAAE